MRDSAGTGSLLGMRIESADVTDLHNVNLWLTHAEASELRDALDDMLERGPSAEWHAHVSSADYQTEVSVAWDESPVT